MLVIDVSPSMRATDVSPSRLAAAEEAGKQLADELTPGINLGLIEFGGSAIALVSPTTNREATKIAIGESIFTALQTIATVGAVIGGGDTPPPARIVLLSDGEENMPSNPDAPTGALPPPELPRIRVCRFQRSRSGRPTGTSISTTSIVRCRWPARR
jgi:Ca-activated chloride channel family protein